VCIQPCQHSHGEIGIDIIAIYSTRFLTWLSKGVGLLGLPFACAKAGVLGGTFAIVSFGFVCWKTSILVGRELNGDPRPSRFFDDSPWKTPLQPGSVPEARMRKPISSFPDIAREAFGNYGALVLAIVLYFELFSCICIFLVSIGDHMNTLFPEISVPVHMIGCALVSAIPIIFLRTAKLLSYLSMVGTFATICVVGAVIFSYLFEGDLTDEAAKTFPSPPDPPYHNFFRSEGMAVTFGLVAYCFSGHAIIPSIYRSMKNPQDYEKMVDWSFMVVISCCLAVGLSGYAMFGNLVFDQVTISLAQSSSMTVVMNGLTCLMVLTAFSKLTLTMYPLARTCRAFFDQRTVDDADFRLYQDDDFDIGSACCSFCTVVQLFVLLGGYDLYYDCICDFPRSRLPKALRPQTGISRKVHVLGLRHGWFSDGCVRNYLWTVVSKEATRRANVSYYVIESLRTTIYSEQSTRTEGHKALRARPHSSLLSGNSNV
jgi:solute carrier family 32 (vesicular inhibitory amino acid transporter)